MRGSVMRFLPVSPSELDGPADVVLVQGDAYVDHPSFGPAVVGRFLESLGLRVAVLAQPDWHSADPFRLFGRPRLFFAVTAGNLDSMLNRLTAQKQNRKEDHYSPGGRPGQRPDRATIIYAQRCREAYPDVPIIIGGIEASLRRIAHYDYWSDTVRRSILVDSKANLLVYGMGERPLKAIVERMRKDPNDNLRGIPGTAWLAGGKESPEIAAKGQVLPSYEIVREDKLEFARMTGQLHSWRPHHGEFLVQMHGDRALVIEEPAAPLADGDGGQSGDLAMDDVYALPFAYRPHPSYNEPIPAFETVRNSITLMRGCFGGCAFCAITAHTGKQVQSRSIQSVLDEIERLKHRPGFDGVLSDLGGPSANLYAKRCSADPSRCKRHSCLFPNRCKNMNPSHSELRELLQQVRDYPGVKRAFIASGIRYDFALEDPKYIEDLARHHVGGQLSLAPEHIAQKTLAAMGKPPIERYEQFCQLFEKASEKVGKNQYCVPYFITGHPGCSLQDAVELALWLKSHHLRPRQVQDFIPTPMTRATAMYYTGLDPDSLQPVSVARGLREKRMQKALVFYWDPEQQPLAREALIAAGRSDLIGRGPQFLVPPAGCKSHLKSAGSSPSKLKKKPNNKKH